MSEGDKKQQLAFAADPQLTPATSQSRLTTKDGAILNIEYFTSKTSSSSSSSNDESQQKQPPIVNLLFIHGVCESAETWSIQHLARAVAKTNHINLIVLELEGHGLSSGSRAVNGDFHRLRRHVIEFIHHCKTNNDTNFLYAIGGTSLGGVLAAYAAHEFKSDDDHCLGAILIAPAVGVDPRAVPPPPIVGALRCVAMLCPGAQLPLTPLEDPSHYACPSSSTRNFKGYWPLSTSRMLLDVTAGGVTNDLNDGTLTIDGDNIAVLVIAGDKDNIVPLDSVQMFFDKIGTTNKEFVPVVGAGHDLMFEAKTAGVVIEKVFSWINSRLEIRR